MKEPAGGKDPLEKLLAEELVRKLKGSEARFRAILDTATDGVLSIDADHHITLFNQAAQKMFSYDASEVMGRDLNLLIPPQYGDHYRYVRRFVETKTPHVIGKTLTLSALRKGGEEFPIELGLSCLDMDGQVTFTAIIRDISGHKQLEKKLLQSQRLAAVGQAVAQVAHEIRNPLMIIGAFSEQIKKTATDPKAVQKLEIILDEVSRLQMLISDLGDFTKVYSLVKRPADINSLVRDVLRLMAELHPTGKYSFREVLSQDIKEVHCDPDKLKQVLTNVISNGLEAMGNGGVITVTTDRCGGGVQIRIDDEGVGIDGEDLPRIFDPFFTTRPKGYGLGLSICYKIVEAHQGEIWAEQSPWRRDQLLYQDSMCLTLLREHFLFDKR